MEEAFQLDSRGYCVRSLQNALGIPVDGRFGPRTYEAVAKVEREIGRQPHGRADLDVFAYLGLPWPTEFDRALALVAELEGTSYGDCNASDVDGAGLTMGIAGFTTHHGEVQAIIETFLRQAPEAWAWVPRPLQRDLKKLLEADASVDEWERIFLDTKRRPVPAVRAVLAAWGEHPFMQELQRSWVYERFWQPAVRVAKNLDLDTPAGRALMFDVWVQNGGWRKEHAQRYVTQVREGDTARARLQAAALAVAAEAKSPWRADVLSRKLMFARGAGMVHGVFYSLAAQAVIPS
ncbi:MAG: chitosanase [Candidatus Sumerlaeaceae bacterium]|nr:chitosanase [Candidatus Sumerlaeaceae bacterium]